MWGRDWPSEGSQVCRVDSALAQARHEVLPPVCGRGTSPGSQVLEGEQAMTPKRICVACRSGSWGLTWELVWGKTWFFSEEEYQVVSPRFSRRVAPT